VIEQDKTRYKAINRYYAVYKKPKKVKPPVYDPGPYTQIERTKVMRQQKVEVRGTLVPRIEGLEQVDIDDIHYSVVSFMTKDELQEAIKASTSERVLKAGTAGEILDTLDGDLVFPIGNREYVFEFSKHLKNLPKPTRQRKNITLLHLN
jgi:hypothetical protein